MNRNFSAATVNRPIIAVPFVLVNEANNPNVTATGAAHASAYWDGILCTLGSIRRWNPCADVRLVTNVPAPDVAQKLLARMNVTQTVTQFLHEPPRHYYHRFAASFFVIDALRALAGSAPVVLLDPDVLCVANMDEMICSVERRAPFGALRLNTKLDEKVNGLSIRESIEIFSTIPGTFREPVRHYGGEVYVFARDRTLDILREVEVVWQESLKRACNGETRLTTEEHLFNFVAARLGAFNIEQYVRRIWTARRYRTVQGDEEGLTLWHLPAEKGKGFTALRPYVEDHNSWFWRAEALEYCDEASRLLSLKHRTLFRATTDLAYSSIWRVRQAVVRRIC